MKLDKPIPITKQQIEDIDAVLGKMMLSNDGILCMILEVNIQISEIEVPVKNWLEIQNWQHAQAGP